MRNSTDERILDDSKIIIPQELETNRREIDQGGKRQKPERFTERFLLLRFQVLPRRESSHLLAHRYSRDQEKGGGRRESYTIPANVYFSELCRKFAGTPPHNLSYRT